jgi:hypothetical protein
LRMPEFFGCAGLFVSIQTKYGEWHAGRTCTYRGSIENFWRRRRL